MLFLLFIAEVIARSCDPGHQRSPLVISTTRDAKYFRLELRFKADSLILSARDGRLLYHEESTTPEFRMMGHDEKGLFVGYKPVEIKVTAVHHQIMSQVFDLEFEIWGELLIIYKNQFKRAALTLLLSVTDRNDIDIFQNITPQGLTINMMSLANQLSKVQKYYTYRGSETLGTCDDKANRFIIPEVISISRDQYEKLSEFIIPSKIIPDDQENDSVTKGTLIIDDQTSVNFNVFHRYLSLTFIALLFLLIFALFIKEQRQKAEQARKIREAS